MKKQKNILFPKNVLPPFILIILSGILILAPLKLWYKKILLTPNHDNTTNNVSSSPTAFFIDYIVITETPIPTPTKTPTPVPTKTPTPLPYTSADYERWFTIYSNNQGINRELLKKIAICESKLNPLAINGIYGGLYQFSINSWISTRQAMNLDTNPDLRFNPEEAIKTAAFKLAVAGTEAWPVCGK